MDDISIQFVSLHSYLTQVLTIKIKKMNQLLLLGPLGTGEIIIICVVILLIFGGKKIPELMKGIGRGVKNFREGVKGIEDDIKLDDVDK
jgi:sec-independent protein translocase protein TatA